MRSLGAGLGPVWQFRVGFAALLYVSVVVETLVLYVRHGRALSAPRAVTNLTILIVELAMRVVTFSVRYAAGLWLAALAPVHFRWTVASSLACYLLVDVVYYFRHRFWHSTGWGWAVHSTHHSSEEMNLLAAIRLSWIEALVDYLLYLPLVLAGFDPLQLLVMVELNLFAQFWCHTDTIGPLPWLDPWLNTPWNHRRHHARSRTLADGNYGSTFMVWDRLFGTYRAGCARVDYGIDGERESLNPLALQFGYLWRRVAARGR
jgi:sterol desaturase/sphingolipid hydroxylase (fatty acid hydroxylase superfamily)